LNDAGAGIPEGADIASAAQRLQKLQRTFAQLTGPAPEEGKADKRAFIVDPMAKVGIVLMTPAMLARREGERAAKAEAVKADTRKLAAVNARARYEADALAAGVKL
jgi:hypothetical protein